MNTTLACPYCLTPVGRRVDMVSYGVPRYTCPACGETTLREELSDIRNLSWGGGGSMAVTPTTCRPPGEIGDQSDATYFSVNSINTLMYASFTVPDYRVQVPALTGTISAVDFYVRGTFTFEDQGPAVPALYVASYIDAGITPVLVGTLAVNPEALIPTTYGPFTLTSHPNGSAWSAANIQSLYINMAMLPDDNGSGFFTTLLFYDGWVVIR